MEAKTTATPDDTGRGRERERQIAGTDLAQTWSKPDQNRVKNRVRGGVWPLRENCSERERDGVADSLER